MSPERRKLACAAIRAAMSSRQTELLLLSLGHDGQSIADAFAIGQASDVPSLFEPVPMRLVCPRCCALHVDEGEFATKTHHTHACQSCGEVWRPAIAPTVGVRFLPGFKNS